MVFLILQFRLSLCSPLITNLAFGEAVPMPISDAENPSIFDYWFSSTDVAFTLHVANLEKIYAKFCKKFVCLILEIKRLVWVAFGGKLAFRERGLDDWGFGILLIFFKIFFIYFCKFEYSFKSSNFKFLMIRNNCAYRTLWSFFAKNNMAASLLLYLKAQFIA